MIELPLKTRRSARLMRLVTLFGIALLVITTLFAAWTSVAGEPRHDTVSMHVDSRGLAGWPAATVLLLVGSLLVIALSYLVAMLRRVEAGAPFAAAPQLRGFARFLFLSVLASVLLPPLILLALGSTMPGEQRITFALAGSDLLTLFVTGLLYFVSRLLDDAQRVADDFSQIV